MIQVFSQLEAFAAEIHVGLTRLVSHLLLAVILLLSSMTVGQIDQLESNISKMLSHFKGKIGG